MNDLGVAEDLPLRFHPPEAQFLMVLRAEQNALAPPAREFARDASGGRPVGDPLFGFLWVE